MFQLWQLHNFFLLFFCSFGKLPKMCVCSCMQVYVVHENGYVLIISSLFAGTTRFPSSSLSISCPVSRIKTSSRKTDSFHGQIVLEMKMSALWMLTGNNLFYVGICIFRSVTLIVTINNI